MPAAGGMDDQPATRFVQMMFAERVRALFEKKATSEAWAKDMTKDDMSLFELLRSEELNDG